MIDLRGASLKSRYLASNKQLFAVAASFMHRVKFVERFIKRNGLLRGGKQFPAKRGIKYLSLRAAVQFSERRYARATLGGRLLAGEKNLSRSRYCVSSA